MAIDTAERRRSALIAASGLHWMVPNPPLPDGSVAARDRATLRGVYSGLDYSNAVAKGVASATDSFANTRTGADASAATATAADS